MLSIPTTCPFCSCGCGFFLLASNGEAAGVTPSEKHPVARGRLCARGWNAHEAPLWGSRLLHPMIRRNENLETISWNAALDHVRGRLRSLMDAGKPIGVLGSPRATNEENYLAGRLARAGLKTNHVDFCYQSLCRPLLAGTEDVTGDSFHSTRLTDIESSDTIVLLEGDLASTHPRAASLVMKALERGARLIVIGCAQTQMARLASSFLQTAPGCEGKVLNGLLAALPDAVLRTAPDSFRRGLRGVDSTVEIQWASQWIAADRVVFLMGPTGGSAVQLRRDAAALASLAAITGHLGKPGSGLLQLLARSNVRGACDMGLAPDRLPGYEPIDYLAARKRVERVWSNPLPADPGFDAENMLESVSGLIVLADNPAAVLPMGERSRAALEHIEFLVVLDAFVTPVMNAAHIALPIASYAETDGTFTNMEGRVQRVRASGAPPGEARMGWKVLAELCARFDAGNSWNSTTEVLEEIAQAAPRYAMAPLELDDGWGSSFVEEPEWVPYALATTSTEASLSVQRPYVLARAGAFDWGDDPLISFSPTLSRDYESERKLFPNGLVEMNSEDAKALGVREGWRVKLRSVHGDAIVPIRPRSDLRPGALLVPYGCRDCVSSVLAEEGIAAVSVERA